MSASDKEAHAICSSARMDDPVAVHYARFALHIVRNVPLPDGYAGNVLRAPQYRDGVNVYLAPLESHVRRMALYAANLETCGVDIEALCCRYNSELQRAAVFRFARAPLALSEDRLRQLSLSENSNVRRVVARLLGVRDSPSRREILARLLDDPNATVSSAAEMAAVKLVDTEMSDLLAPKGRLYALCFAGDPRARATIEALVDSEDPLELEWAVACAHALGNRNLIARLWKNPDWDTRMNAIVVSASDGLLSEDELDRILARETPDHVAELVLRWPRTLGDRLRKVSWRLCEPNGPLPRFEALNAGQADAIRRVQAWVPSDRNLLGAAIRLLPTDVAVPVVRELSLSAEAGARVLAVLAVAYCPLEELYPIVAELCLDSDEEVVTAACRAIEYGRIRCGLYGLDTGILRSGALYSPRLRFSLGRLVENRLKGKPGGGS